MISHSVHFFASKIFIILKTWEGGYILWTAQVSVSSYALSRKEVYLGDVFAIIVMLQYLTG